MTGRCRRLQILLLSVVIGAMLLRSVHAGAETLPPIVDGTQREIIVHQGDTFTLEVRMRSGEEASYQWTRANEYLCATPSCPMTTASWGLGRHAILLKMEKQENIYFIHYGVTVVSMPWGERAREITLPLEPDLAVNESITKALPVARTTAGRSFLGANDGLESLGQEWKSIGWVERLRSYPASTVLFGVASQDVHVIGAKSDIWLARSDAVTTPFVVSPEERGRVVFSPPAPQRLILLLDGTLRSRQLAERNPAWTILIPRKSPSTDKSLENPLAYESWLQVQPDAVGDVAIVRQSSRRKEGPRGSPQQSDREVVHIMVIRGSAQVTRIVRRDAPGRSRPKDSFETMHLTAGTALKFEVDGSPEVGLGAEWPKMTIPEPALFAKVFAETTPQYLYPQDPLKFGGEWTLLNGRFPGGAAQSLAAAQTALMEGDFLRVLEILYPFVTTLDAAEKAQLLLGRAYAGLGLSSAARTHLQFAVERNPANPEPHVILAHVAMGEKRWQSARAELALAAQRGARDEPWLNYYHGVIGQRMGHHRLSRKEMLATIHDAEEERLKSEAQRFVASIDRKLMPVARIKMGSFYDSYVLRTRVNQEERLGPDALRVQKAGGLDLSLFLEFLGHKDSESALGADFLVEKKVFSDSRLRILDPLKIEWGVPLVFQSEASSVENPWVRLELRPFIGTRFVGTARASDEIGGHFAVQSPRLRFLFLGLRSRLSKDPAPDRDDIWDPSLREIIPKGNQSYHDAGAVIGLALHKSSEGQIFTEWEQDEWTYDSAGRLSESFVVQKALVRGQHVLHKDHTLDWESSILTRDFASSGDKRRDLDFSAHAGWSFVLSPLVSQTVGITLERQKSTRPAHSFIRQLLEYRFQFDF